MKPLLFGALLVTLAIACGPQFPRAVFTYSRHPDFPRTGYLNGKLGVVQPGYARSYLVIAFRYLKGRPLNGAEREQVRDYWKDRGTGAWDKTTTEWGDKWDATRVRVPGAISYPVNAITGGRYALDMQTSEFAINCADDAYRVATETLLARGARFGIRSATVRGWRDAQDQVFRNCDKSGPFMPKPATPDMPASIRADREYQIAAANFYAFRYAEAEAQFRKIAADTDSPWKGIAPYLVVRTLMRAAEGQPNFVRAQNAAQQLLADPQFTQLHGMTRVLLHRMLLKSGDETYFHEIARDLASGQQGASFREELWVYTELFDHFVDYDPWEIWGPPKKKNLDPKVFERDELSDWIYTFQRKDDEAAATYAVKRWRKGGGLPWLMAAMVHARAESPDAADLVAAAGQVTADNPGFEMASFHRLRLMVEMNRRTEAKKALELIMATPISRSGTNLFRALQMRTAPDLREYLFFAGRKPVMLTRDDNVGEVPWPEEWYSKSLKGAAGKVLFDRDSIRVLNKRTPLRILQQAALGNDVPEHNVNDFALTVFTRALLLEDWETVSNLAAKLRELGADRQEYLAGFDTPKAPEEQRFSAIFYLLHHPESRPYLSSGVGRMGNVEKIDDYRDNWWCPVDIAIDLDARTNMFLYGELMPAPPDTSGPSWQVDFLTDPDKSEAAEEMKKLAATNSGPDYLIAETMRYAKAHPRDLRVPEALHYALRSQRYGCVRKETRLVAEEAWRYLWRRYPKNLWTSKTNYDFQAENIPTRRQ